MQVDTTAAQFDLVLQASMGKVLLGEILYSTDLFSTETATRIAGHFKVSDSQCLSDMSSCKHFQHFIQTSIWEMQEIVESITDAPDTPIDRLDFITQPERELLLRDFNSNVLAPSELMHPEQTMHGMLEYWAAIQSDAPALIFEARPHRTWGPSAYAISITWILCAWDKGEVRSRMFRCNGSVSLAMLGMMCSIYQESATWIVSTLCFYCVWRE